MSEELKSELGTEMSIAEIKARAKEEKPVATRLYTEWRKTQPKTTSKEEMSANYKAYKLSMGIVDKKSTKGSSRVKKVKDVVEDVSKMIGDFNIGNPDAVVVSA